MLKYRDFKEKIQLMFYLIFKTGFNSERFAEKRLCPKNAEKPGMMDDEGLLGNSKKGVEEVKKPGEKLPEKPKQPGVPIDTDPKKDEKEPSTGPRLPERAKDALTGTELMKKYGECKNDKEKQQLFLDQLHLGNVTESWRNGFRKVTVEKNGKKLEFMVAPGGLRFGTDKDFIEFPTNGPMAEAAAQAVGCTLPNQWMVDQSDNDAKKNAQFIPFKPQVFTYEDSLKMRSPEFIQNQNAHVTTYAAEHGIDLTKPTYGYFKHVVLQSPGQKGKNHLDIYGGYYERLGKNGKGTGESGALVQPSGVRHDIDHDDYSQQALMVLDMGSYNGEPRPVREIIADPVIAKEFGFAVIPADQTYRLPDWMQQAVAQIKQQQPAGASSV